MAKKKREVPEINSSSTADIAFLLLIFFLITTSMDTDRGLARRLPPPPEKDQKLDDAKKKERNVLQVFLNMQDQLMCGNDYITVDQLRAKAKEFIANPYNEDTKPEKISKNVPFFGTVQVTEGHVTVSYTHLFPVLVNIVPLFHIFQNFVKASFFPFGLQFVIAALCPYLGGGGYKKFQLGIRKNGSADVAPVHNDTLGLAHLLLLCHHSLAYEIQCCNGADT